MDNNNSVVVLFTLVAFFVLAFVFALFGLAESNALFITLAFLGFVIVFVVALIFGLTNSREGNRITLWFFIYGGAVAVTIVWFVTRVARMFNLL